MHRSGTSAVAGYLEQLGFAVPSETLPPHPQDNPGGYFEPRELVQLNNGLLREMGASWQSFDPIDPGCFSAANVAGFRSDARAYLQKVGVGKQSLVLKDPRLTRLMPFWAPLLKECDPDFRLVHVLRDACSVAVSLGRRALDPKLAPAAIEDPLHGTLLWLRYNLDLCCQARALGVSPWVVGYEEFVSERGVRETLLRSLGLSAITKEFVPNRPGRADAEPDLPADWIHVLKAVADAIRRLDVDALNGIDALASQPIPASNQRAPDLPPVELLAAARVRHVSAHWSKPWPYLDTPKKQTSTPGRDPGRDGILFVTADAGTRGHLYRVKNPVDALSRKGLTTHWTTLEHVSSDLSVLAGYRHLIVHRCEWGEGLAALYRAARAAGIRIVYDIDDLVFDPAVLEAGEVDFIQRLNQAERAMWRARFKKYRQALCHADLSLVPTASLQEAAEAAGTPSVIKPNGLSPETIALSRFWASRPLSGARRLGYASGTPTHQGDFAQIEDVLIDCLGQHPDWTITVIGHLDVTSLRKRLGAGRVETRPVVAHINLAFELARLDLTVAPLEMNNAFCAGKSPLKWFEAAAVDVPVIASETGAFRDAIRHGKTGLLAADETEWAVALERLMSSADERRAIASAASEDVLGRFAEDIIADALIRELDLIG